MVRSFRDDDGVTWEVREIREPAMAIVPTRLLTHPEFGDGWLLFSSARERRRLAPYPRDWRMLSTYELSAWCRRARPVVERTRSAFEIPVVAPRPEPPATT